MIFEEHPNEKIKKLIDKPIQKDEVSVNEFLTELKNSGATLMNSISILKIKLNLSLRAAKEMVINSDAWSNEKDSFLEFQQVAIHILNKEADEVTIENDATVFTFKLANNGL